MTYNFVGIDTIRFSVSESGFNIWLAKNNLEKVNVSDTPLTSQNLLRKVRSGVYVRVVRINDSYSNKLSNYLLIEKSKKRHRHYIVSVAGLHQPTNIDVHKMTYAVTKSLLEKYIVESIDLAFDFLARNREVIERENVAALLSSTIRHTIHDTTYFRIGASDGEDPTGSVWSRDSLLYYKYGKESVRNAGLNPLWYRLEFRIDSDVYFREPSRQRPKATNKQFLKNLMNYIDGTPITETVDTLASTSRSHQYLEKQITLLFDGRVLKHYA